MVEVEISDFTPDASAPPLFITLALGISRGLHMDYALQKSVELGVSAIVPLFTGRCNVKLDNKRMETRMEHWRKIMIHACEQSGRNSLPDLLAPHSLDEWVKSDVTATRLLLAPAAGQTLGEIARVNIREISVLAGPEGGLTDAEQSTAAERGYIPVRLGPRTLRTETAAVAAVTALQVLWGDLR